MIGILTKILTILIFISLLQSQDFRQIDKDLNNFEYQKTIIPLQTMNNNYPKNIQVLTRLSAAYHFLSEQSVDKKLDKLNNIKSLKYITEAMSIDPEHPEVHKWYAISYGKHVEGQSIRKQIESSKIIAFHCLQAIEKNPNDPFCYNIMGQWHYRLASINPLSRRLASIIFEEPPIGSFEKAEYFLQKSLTLNPDYIGTYYWLGKTYGKLKMSDKKISLFNTAVNLKRPYKREKVIYEEIKKELKKLKHL